MIFEGIVVLLLWLVLIAVLIISLMGIYLLLSSLGEQWAPPVRSSGKLKDAILEDVSAYLKKTSKGLQIVDLGSGWGTLLLPLAQRFPEHNFVGVERAFSPFYVSRFRARKLSNLKFVRGDLFEYDLSKTDVVLLFLIGFMMPRVTKKCQKELKSGALVYASRFPLVGVAADTVVHLSSKMETYYVYEIK